MVVASVVHSKLGPVESAVDRQLLAYIAIRDIRFPFQSRPKVDIAVIFIQS
jgi:hypothetical protein